MLAGRLDERSIERLGRSIAPDLFAVRGAACEAGDRRNAIEFVRVAKLAAAARKCGSTSPCSFQERSRRRMMSFECASQERDDVPTLADESKT